MFSAEHQSTLAPPTTEQILQALGVSTNDMTEQQQELLLSTLKRNAATLTKIYEAPSTIQFETALSSQYGIDGQKSKSIVDSLISGQDSQDHSEKMKRPVTEADLHDLQVNILQDLTVHTKRLLAQIQASGEATIP
ncbi:hypothetical protein BLNAU_6491 [Blattamonas nauphoetae]|uniref:COMM domain-containing protein n=1 Tax=Blattamonas nauphoetae TaxID=2049346 RepID=A0ABQ9Y3X3_9EUKA|nr:hypothetical protein BLNAU_6491 [Blattamonas nauphoetae]